MNDNNTAVNDDASETEQSIENPQVETETMLEEIRDVAGILGHTPTLHQYDRHPDTHSFQTLKKRLGKWENVIDAADINEDEFTRDVDARLDAMPRDLEEVIEEFKWRVNEIDIEAFVNQLREVVNENEVISQGIDEYMEAGMHRKRNPRRSRETEIAAGVYSASKAVNYPLHADELSDVMGIERKQLIKATREIESELNTFRLQTDVESFFERFYTELEAYIEESDVNQPLSEDTRNVGDKIVSVASDAFPNRRNDLVAVAAVFAALDSDLTPKRVMTYDEFTPLFPGTEVGIRNIVKEIQDSDALTFDDMT